VIGRVALQPSGQYPNADWFYLPSVLFGLCIVFGPIPLSMTMFYSIFRVVKDIESKEKMEYQVAKRLSIHLLFFLTCWTPPAIMMLMQVTGLVDDTNGWPDAIAGVSATWNATWYVVSERAKRRAVRTKRRSEATSIIVVIRRFARRGVPITIVASSLRSSFPSFSPRCSLSAPLSLLAFS